ncbi:MAG: hypothetical protein KDA42_18260 [Planctomycetales bacterium]|nr:hypothetical protein [Planctomycetales bacterium]
MTRRRGSSCGRRRALSLFEVILALAILAGAIAVISELTRNAGRNAVRSSELTAAQLVCESVMSELSAGIIEPAPANQMQFSADPEWVYSIQLNRGELEGLVAATVTVEPSEETSPRGVSFSLVRWIPDPGIEIPDETDEERQATGADDDSSSNGTPSTGNNASSGSVTVPPTSGGGLNGARP